MEIIYKSPSELKPFQKNPYNHPEKQLTMLKKSMREFGFTSPILVSQDNMVIAGHARLKAAQEIGLSEVPTIFIDLPYEKAVAYVIADNQLAKLAEEDRDLLGELLQGINDIPDFDIEAVGFSSEDIDSLLKSDEVGEVVEDEFNPDEEVETRCKEGDLWQLGRHRLLCGDSTKKEDVERLMNGVKADMVFTDPPYGMGKESEGVLNDNLYNNKLLDFNQKWIPLSFSVLSDVGSWYCWGCDEPLMDIYSEIIKPMVSKNEATFRNLITWDKGNGQGQNSEDFRMYPIADEKCLFVMKGVQGFNTNSDNYYEDWEPVRKYIEDQINIMGWNDKIVASFFGFHPRMANHWHAKSQFTLITEEQYKTLQNRAEYGAFKKEYDEIKKEYDEIKKEYYSTRAYFDNTHDNMNNVWHFSRTSETERELTGGHATPKPLELCARGIKSSSKEGGLVVDMFLGSGSTLIACEQLNRTCYGMELDPHYCDVILSRWEQFTNQTAKKLN